MVSKSLLSTVSSRFGDVLTLTIYLQIFCEFKTHFWGEEGQSFRQETTVHGPQWGRRRWRGMSCCCAVVHRLSKPSDFRLQRHIFKQDCRKSKPVLVGLRSCRWEVWDITSRKGREKEKKQKKKNQAKEEQKRKQRRIVDGLYFKPVSIFFFFNNAQQNLNLL